MLVEQKITTVIIKGEENVAYAKTLNSRGAGGFSAWVSAKLAEERVVKGWVYEPKPVVVPAETEIPPEAPALVEGSDQV